jgi:hypothetical protein
MSSQTYLLATPVATTITYAAGECQARKMPNNRIKKRKLCPCGTRPSYSLAGDRTPTCCKKCRTSNMVDVVNKRCLCGKARPIFGHDGDIVSTCCKSCKTAGMRDIKSLRCGCGLHKPCFGLETDKAPSRCSTCRTAEMVDISNRRCRCGSARPVFGYHTDDRANSCSKCKDEDMIDICSPKCLCGRTQPRFGVSGQARASCCANCKTTDMINLKDKRCQCGRASPSYGVSGASRMEATHCQQCKTVLMVNVASPRCVCGRVTPTFGYFGDARATCCLQCRESSMLDISNRRCFCGNAQPSQAHAGSMRATHCARCRETGMIDIVSPRCESEACTIYNKHDRAPVRYKVQGVRICASCCQRQYPEIAKRGLSMRTELLVIAEIERLVPELSTATAVIWDCPANCSTRLAPDRIWFFQVGELQRTLHLEIDEVGRAHEDSDERAAVIQESADADASWLIRFNPGRSSDGRPACVQRKVTDDGDKRYERTPGPEWEHRTQALASTVRDVYSLIHSDEQPTQSNWKTKLFF